LQRCRCRRHDAELLAGLSFAARPHQYVDKPRGAAGWRVCRVA
jgi:hypothetical protein